jgi:hypothetical protein
LKVFLVNDGGKPLSAPGGRAKFFVAGTSTPEPVYSDIDLTEATALGPVVYTDELGYLPAIWLKTDRLYKVRVEQKLPGTPEVWSLLWEVDNVGYIDPHESEEPGEPQITVDSITALKAVDHSAHSVVMVDGYYSAGDFGTPSTFVWSATSTRHDDGGSVIRPNDVASGNAGRWIQVFSGDVIDVRKFGAIPDLTENSDVTAKVVNAINYAQQNSTRSRPLTIAFLAPGKYEFAGDFDFTQYADFVDLSDNSHHKLNWLIGEDVVFKGDDSDFTLSNNTVCLTREALIEGTSATLSIEGGGSIKVDPAWWGDKACSVSDCYVECHSVTTNNKRFERCSVNSNRMFGAGVGYVTLVEMYFKEEWFASDFDWSHLLLTDTTISVYDCFSANSYIDIKNAQGDYDYGDLNEKTVTGKELGNGCVLENALLSNVVIKGDCELHNVSGTVSLDSSSPADLNFIDCWISFGNDADIGIGSLHFRRGNLDFDNIIEVSGNCYLNDVVVDATIKAMALFVAVACDFNKNVEQWAVLQGGAYTLDGRVEHCNFSAGGHVIRTDDAGTNTFVNIEWIGNNGIFATPINVTYVLAHVNNTNEQNYKYEGNVGTFQKNGIKGYKATSFTVTDMTKGWRINPVFADTSIFAIGKKEVIVSVKANVNDGAFGNLCAFACVKKEITDGTLLATDLSLSVQFPDIETEVNTVMKDLAANYPDSVGIYADVEIA